MWPRAGAVPGNKTTTFETARAQYHLRQCCVYLNMFPLNRPDVLVPYVQDKVDSGGRLTDVKVREKIRERLEALAAATKRLKAG